MVNVRFAPSPTGSLHLGNALSAVANRCFADRDGCLSGFFGSSGAARTTTTGAASCPFMTPVWNVHFGTR